MQVEARVAGEQALGRGCLVGAVIVENEVKIELRRCRLIDPAQEPDESMARCLSMHWPITLPLSTSSAANRVVVP